MANKSDLETYIMRCAREYEKKHPEKKVHAKKTIDIPMEECVYCSGGENITDIPFSIKMRLMDKRLIIENDNELFGIDIKYCPMCGRQL